MATTNGTRASFSSLRGPLFLASVALSLAACGVSPETPVAEDVGQAIQPIIKGVTSGTEHDSVVVLVTYVGAQPASLCTATLVAPNLLLTARHCVSDVPGATGCGQDGSAVTGGAIAGDRDPSSLVVFTGKNGAAPAIDDRTKGAASGTKLVVDDATNVCGHDLAFVVLDRAVDAPAASLRLTPVAASEGIAAIGFGVDETGSLSPTRTFRSGLPASVGPALYPDDARYGYGASEFMVGESLCAGDSGGPALSATGAVLGVAARAGNGQPRVTSYADTCVGPKARAVYASLSAHTDLVTRAFEAAGAAPKVEGAPASAATADVADAPAESSPATSATTTGTDVTTPAEASSGAGGCSMSSEPQKGSVEYAAGLVALLASLVGLRRRLGKRDEEDHGPRDRLPSLPY